MTRGWLRLSVAADAQMPGYDIVVREEDVLAARSAQPNDGLTSVKLREEADNMLMAQSWKWLLVTQSVAEVHSRLMTARKD